MRKFEYKVFVWTTMFNELQEQLCILGLDGWDLVSTNIYKDFTQCFLKREINVEA